MTTTIPTTLSLFHPVYTNHPIDDLCEVAGHYLPSALETFWTKEG